MNKKVSLVIIASNKYLKNGCKESWKNVNQIPLWIHIAEYFNSKLKIDITTAIVSNDNINYAKHISKYNVSDNIKTSLDKSIKNVDIIILCNIKAEYNTKNIDDIIDSIDNDIEYISNFKTDNLDHIKHLTVQVYKTDILKNRLDKIVTLKKCNCSYIPPLKNEKIVLYLKNEEEIDSIDSIQNIIVGNGFDIHKFTNGDNIVLCGVSIPFHKTFLAHSDGDVAIHAIIDSILGAIGAGDIGELFPDNDIRFKSIKSTKLLDIVNIWINSIGYLINNIDITIIVEKPNLSQYKNQMRINISNILNMNLNRVNIKATTSEKIGFIGRQEGIAVISSASVINIK